jgi:hypothetical protein
MIDVQELLRAKENELARVQREVEALRTVAMLLFDSDDAEAFPSNADPGAASVQLEASVAQENASEDGPSPKPAEGLFQSIAAKRSRVREWLGRAVGE